MRIRSLAILVAASISLLVSAYAHERLTVLCAANSSVTPGYTIPSLESIRFVSLGFEKLLADFYWLQFIGYVGDGRSREIDKYERGAEYLQVVTGLDPHFIPAYWYAAFVVGGDADQPARAGELIERGMQSNSDSWFLPFIAGVNQCLFARNFGKAANYYLLAARYPGAPNWLSAQAAILKTDAPRLVKEGHSWLSIYESAMDEKVKEHAREKSVAIWVRIFRTAPTEIYRQRARENLFNLGVDIDKIARTQKSR